MKVRKLAVALALAGGLGSGVAQALGLGEIELQSYLNEPLDAEINLRKSEGVSPADVFVNIAPQSAFDRVGIERSFFLTKLNFQVTTAPDGSLMVNVSTREPLREPYLNFLVEITWPSGRLMREYAVLVDPPVYAEESGFDEPVSAPEVSQRSEPQPRVRQQPSAEPTRSTAQSRSSGPRTLGPTDSSDTLWTLAASVRPSSDVTMQQMMLALQDLNPDAFIDGNINRLKRGEVLRVPDENQIRSRSRAEANREVARQNRVLNTPERTVDATDGATDTPAGEASGNDEQLRLLAADDSASRDSSDGGSAGGDGEATGGVDAGTAVAMEELESARRENDELSGRVDDLQDQVQTLQRLLELKNSQLAQMQNTAGESTGQPGESSAPAGEGASAADSESANAQEAMDESAVADDEESTTGSMPAAESDAEPAEMAESTETAQMPQDQSEPVADDQQAAPEQEASAEPAAPAAKPFPGNVIDAITNNFMYQVALGGGLVVLLLLLLLLARRNANREKAFYEQLGTDGDGQETDSFDLTFEDEDDVRAPEEDAIAEADAYIAYGRNDQAAQTLETAISREPSRSDLRLKLLGVYADSQDRESFDKQFREIEALGDEVATAEAMSLQNRLDEVESMPSIDDLESQLRSGGPGEHEEVSYESDYNPEPYGESEIEDMDLDLPDEDDDRSLAGSSGKDDSASGVSLEDRVEDGSGEDRDDPIEYDLSEFEKTDDSELELASELDSDSDTESDDDFDFSLDEDDLPQGEDAKDTPPADDGRETVTEEASGKAGDAESDADDLEISGDGELDESFLDELDAELDKVASEDDLPEDSEGSELDDLELDVSDEDLALMEEFSESDDESPSDTPEKAGEEDLSLDKELGLEDTVGDEPADPGEEVEGAEEADELLSAGEPGADDAETDKEDDSVVPPVAPARPSGGDSEREIDESDLGDDDDFDFLTGTDEAATKLDLARAYVEMGDMDGARDILEEVALEGDEDQKAEAQDLLKNLS